MDCNGRSELATYDLSLGWRSSIIEAQNRVPTGGTPTPGYTLHDLTLTWLPQNGSLKGVRLDFGIDNLTDKDYRRHLNVLRDPGRNYKLAVSYQFLNLQLDHYPPQLTSILCSRFAAQILLEVSLKNLIMWDEAIQNVHQLFRVALSLQAHYGFVL